MEKIIIIICTLLSLKSHCQRRIDTIQSIRLDSLIWSKINQYRISQDLEPILIFEDSLMRSYSRRVTEGNFKRDITKHSDSLGYWSNSECLYRMKRKGNLNWDNYILEIQNENFEYFAEQAVTGWINSESHNHEITRKDIHAATIYSLISVDYANQELRFEVTYSALSSVFKTFDNFYTLKSEK